MDISKIISDMDISDVIAASAAIIATLAILGALLGVFWQVSAKRRDDKHLAQLARVDKQLSNLYGPLYALFEVGDKHLQTFKSIFGDNLTYENEKYRVWAKEVFLLTNLDMYRVIINNSELFLGETLPDVYLEYCLHVAGLKVYIAEWDNPKFSEADWEKYLSEFEHPYHKLHNHIRTSFEILKKEQAGLLASTKWFNSPKSVDEKKLKLLIEEKINNP